ncbi:hypothetical protein [Stenotrophomonas phage A1432]|uniref:Uncharacterized protein n=1 Tax=Stenotrophomonas phage A1432 TaxID=2930315 RepID=A0A9E7N423_9CAUD|nr:hypothetical protein P9A45_gp38 [Stenotrophomonas phage A1432]UTC27992.1 hypothetical protein [Stenotrophomonas phage A1432]
MFEVKFGGKRHQAATLAEASKLFTTWINENDFGASHLSKTDGDLFKGKSRVKFGEVSYNGRTWKGTYGQEGYVEMFDHVPEVIVEAETVAEAAPAATIAIEKRKTIAEVIREGISQGLDNAQVLEKVREAFPNANTSPACVSYYRSKMKKAGATVAPTKAIASTKTKVKGKYVFKKLKYLVPEWKQGYTAEVYLNGVFIGNLTDFWDDGGDNPHYEFDVIGAKAKVNIEQIRKEVGAIFASKKK